MEVALRECPACQAVVMGNDPVCAECGAELPAVVGSGESSSAITLPAAGEVACPRCGMTMPPSVLRCRDCGAFISPEVEAAAMARMANRMYQGARGGAPLTGASGAFGASFGSPASSDFSTVADDDDFDLNPSVSFGEPSVPSQSPFQFAEESSADASESDFELPELGSSESYEVASVPLADPTAVPAADVALKPEPKAAGAEPATAHPPTPSSPVSPGDSVVDHSVQTAGAALLNTALEEEQETHTRQKGGRRRTRSQTAALAPGRFVVFCPNGHRVQVQDKHRGRTGRCPNCKGIFFVPLADTSLTTGEAGAATGSPDEAVAESSANVAASGYTRWITDVSLHRVNPASLKLKPGSVQADALPV
ncbi:MAG: hypothetical protein EHM42_05430, partial [Planctomycetaceae bacterium]